MRYPFLNLKKLHDSIAPELGPAIANVVSNCSFINGPEVKTFERRWADYCGVDAAIGAANGTTALHAILQCLGVNNRDEVICPSHTFIATAESIIMTGAKPVFAEVDPDTWLLNPAELESRITSRTRAIVAVHIYGMPCDMDPINEIACARGLSVIEDASQAHGAQYKGKRAGALGHAACFSFFPGKNLGAFGDAGGITTIDTKLAEMLRLYVNHGRETKYENIVVGTNYRLDTLQAAILLVKLRYLDEWNARRAEIVERYRDRLSQEPFASLPVKLQHIIEGAQSSNHLFVIQIPERDRIADELNKRGVATGLHYPIPCHLQPSMRTYTRGAGTLLITERLCSNILSLPVCPTMSPDDADLICDTMTVIINNLRGIAS